MKAAIYARCSTNKQDLELQLSDLRGFCKRQGYEIHDEYMDVESGSKEARIGLNRLMTDAHKKFFDIVLVWRFDRFSRSLKQLVTSLEYLRNKGIQFISFNTDFHRPLNAIINMTFMEWTPKNRQIEKQQYIEPKGVHPNATKKDIFERIQAVAHARA